MDVWVWIAQVAHFIYILILYISYYICYSVLGQTITCTLLLMVSKTCHLWMCEYKTVVISLDVVLGIQRMSTNCISHAAQFKKSFAVRWANMVHFQRIVWIFERAPVIQFTNMRVQTLVSKLNRPTVLGSMSGVEECRFKQLMCSLTATLRVLWRYW